MWIYCVVALFRKALGLSKNTYFAPREIIPDMRRIRLVIEYDGRPYHGWQTQENPLVPTIQSELEKAFIKIAGIAPEEIIATGRTDKGVHARGMVCHLDTFKEIAPNKIKTGLNRFLPASIAVISAEEVDQHFHARYECKHRVYEYIIFNRHSRSPLWDGLSLHVRHKLDIKAMQEAANFLIGKHDFSAFRSSECQAKSPITTLHNITISRNEDIIRIELLGATFLHNMVRVIVGTLVKVGEGKKSPQDICDILQQKNRTKAGKTVSANGLYFISAEFNK